MFLFPLPRLVSYSTRLFLYHVLRFLRTRFVRGPLLANHLSICDLTRFTVAPLLGYVVFSFVTFHSATRMPTSIRPSP